ncbi:hypothetical protein JOF56_000674 [Kibdelosporangium banguiense]|uniref:Uncharacterized protein n=1 Tax=Kibdelosporangium banguiense TaxID=1365924 RepID=A0ABS4T8N4_9PSEU|nr:hypothetical protein [Kibdelosporangium banguiense]MBP2320289.1 hypothetical protein [Kibdelosporangium banguiense]
MRRLVLFVAALFLLLATPASAGGPTSVLITSPTEQRAAALYMYQSSYSELGSAIGTGQPMADPQAPMLHGTPGSSAINVTWLIHDVQVWRVDHIFLSATDGPWIETYESYEGVKFDQRGVVHRPANASKLTELLTEILGAPDQSKAQPARTIVTSSAPAAAPPPGIQWTSLVIGIVGGMVLAVFGRVVVGVLRRKTPVNPVG